MAKNGDQKLAIDKDPTPIQDRRQFRERQRVLLDQVVEVARRGEPDVCHGVILTGCDLLDRQAHSHAALGARSGSRTASGATEMGDGDAAAVAELCHKGSATGFA